MNNYPQGYTQPPRGVQQPNSNTQQFVPQQNAHQQQFQTPHQNRPPTQQQGMPDMNRLSMNAPPQNMSNPPRAPMQPPRGTAMPPPPGQQQVGGQFNQQIPPRGAIPPPQQPRGAIQPPVQQPRGAMPPQNVQQPRGAVPQQGMPPRGGIPQQQMQPRGGIPQQQMQPRPSMPPQQGMQPRGAPMMARGPPSGQQQFQPRGPPVGGPQMAQPGVPSGMQQQQGFQQQQGYQQQRLPPHVGQQQFIDPASQCPETYMQLTMGKFPNSSSIAAQAKVPLGAIIHPLADDPDGEVVPVVNYGSIGVQRCKSCRAYMNPFVQWTENGRRWRCNICSLVNDTPSQYYSHLDATGQRADRAERAELSKGIYEIIAPADYMVRPPQSPVFVFVIDVSFEAIQSGMVHVAVDAIKKSLDHLPGAPRTQVAIITYDYAVHFYNLKSSLSQAQMLVVSDLEDMFVPLPDDLLVDLADSRQLVEDLLTSLPNMHAQSKATETAFGSALTAAYRVMLHIGGKMCLFQSKLPVIGEGKLKFREKPGIVGSDKEHTFLTAQLNFYKSRALEFLRQQVCVELFLLPQQYCDVASLQALPKYTGGQLHFFPKFNASRDGKALFNTVYRSLSRETAWEAVMRVRASRGVKVSSNAFYGNFVIRGTDLLSLPNCDSDATFGVEFSHEEAVLAGNNVTVQGALLYTTSSGERRIRVTTSCVPITTQPADVLQSVNQEALCVLKTKMVVDKLFKQGFDDARRSLQNFCVDVLRASKSCFGGAYGGAPMGYGQQQQQQQRPPLPPNLELVPLFTMSLIKSPLFRGGTDLSLDERSYLLHTASRMHMDLAKRIMLPHFYSLHDMPNDCGRLVAVPDGEDGPCKASKDDKDVLRLNGQRVKLPKTLSLTAERLQSNGCFLLDTGLKLYMWVGRQVAPEFIQSLFGLPSLDGIDAGVLKLDEMPTDDELKKRICNMIKAIQINRKVYPQLLILKEGDQTDPKFYSHLTEDRATFPGGAFNYGEYFHQVVRLAQQASGH